MDDKQQHIKRQIDKFTELYKNTQSGIFQKKTRERILTKKGLSESSPAKNTFWYRQRENVKTALIDLQLFLEEAGENNVKQIFTETTLSPIIEPLLSTNLRHEPELRKAEIARLFILMGFNYFNKTYYNNLTVSHKNTIHAAVDLADYLAESLKPFKERKYPTYLDMDL